MNALKHAEMQEKLAVLWLETKRGGSLAEQDYSVFSVGFWAGAYAATQCDLEEMRRAGESHE